MLIKVKTNLQKNCCSALQEKQTINKSKHCIKLLKNNIGKETDQDAKDKSN